MSSMPRLAGLLLLCFAACTTETGAPPAVADAWIRAAPPGAPMHAGYLTVTNPSAQPLQVVGVSSPDFERIELHVTVITDGVARMLEEDIVVVPAGSSVVFEPGARHLMLFGARRPLTLDDTVPLTIQLADATSLNVTAIVRAGPDAGAHQHH